MDKNISENHIFWELAGKVLSDDAHEKEKDQLKRIIHENEDFLQVWEELNKDQKSLSAYLDDQKVDVEQAWKRQQDRLQKKRKQQNSYWGIAASILIALGASFLLMTKDTTYFKSSNETKEIRLPDGSAVTLNRDSELRFEDDFNSNRRVVFLKGEAFFEVTSNAQKPFIVRTANSSVKVLGTSFNVNTDDETKVYVQEGRVLLSSKDELQQITLGMGEQGIHNKNDVYKSITSGEDALLWKTRNIIFRNDDLAALKRKLELVYHVEIRYSDRLKHCRHTAEYDNVSLDTVLETLQSIYNIGISKEDSKTVLNFRSCD